MHIHRRIKICHDMTESLSVRRRWIRREAIIAWSKKRTRVRMNIINKPLIESTRRKIVFTTTIALPHQLWRISKRSNIERLIYSPSIIEEMIGNELHLLLSNKLINKLHSITIWRPLMVIRVLKTIKVEEIVRIDWGRRVWQILWRHSNCG